MTTALTDEDLATDGESPFGPDFNVPDDASAADDSESGADPDAPYGRNPKTGKPYRYSKEERERRAQVMNAARWGNRPPKPKAPGRVSSSPSSSKGKRADYRPAVAMMGQLASFALANAARVLNKPALALDSMTVTLYTEPLAEVVDEAAQQHAWLATALDKAMTVGPYAGALGILVPLGMQLAANHGTIPANPDLGILDGDGLVAAVTAATAKK